MRTGSEASGDQETEEKARDVSGAIVLTSGPYSLYTETIVTPGLSSLLF